MTLVAVVFVSIPCLSTDLISFVLFLPRLCRKRLDRQDILGRVIRRAARSRAPKISAFWRWRLATATETAYQQITAEEVATATATSEAEELRQELDRRQVCVSFSIDRAKRLTNEQKKKLTRTVSNQRV